MKRFFPTFLIVSVLATCLPVRAQNAAPAIAAEDLDQPKSKGKPAPAFSLPLLDGGRADLVQHAGKEVVILDFWATWCGPCVLALPILTEIAAAYREKEVRLYTVNQGEDEPTIRDFLAKKKLKMAVALDTEGKVAKSYGVEGLPQTIIIDRAGVVRAVHLGFSPDLKEMITGELDAVLGTKAP